MGMTLVQVTSSWSNCGSPYNAMPLHSVVVVTTVRMGDIPAMRNVVCMRSISDPGGPMVRWQSVSS